ncbi:MAG: hypothetical protein ACK4NZ_07725 [Tsuneonella sp.]
MKILKSLEEALYEVMVWLVFYPLTMWQVLTRPAAMMSYADDELDDADVDRYSDKLSPPIFLAITLGLSHVLELAMGIHTEQPGVLSQDQNLIAFRMIVFSVFPLVLAVRLLRRKGVALDRKTLRPPFYAQCFVAAPWALVAAAATLYASAGGASPRRTAVAIAVVTVAWIWYMALQANWFARNLDISWARGLWNAVVTFLQATVIIIALAFGISQFS